jgi:RNA polymerase sigma-70 factor (ECF subfamily)
MTTASISTPTTGWLRPPAGGCPAAAGPWPAASTQNAARALPRPALPVRLSPAHDAFERQLAPLWQRAQAGDEAAYRESLRLIAARLRSYLRRRMQSLPDELEDLVQETLLALHLQRGTHDPAVPVSAWVLAVARHKLVDLWRRRGRQEALHDPLDDVDEAALAGHEPEAGSARDLGVLLAVLPEAQRAAIVLTKLEGLSVAEASARTGASESAIKVQVHRGLKRLAALVGPGRSPGGDAA